MRSVENFVVVVVSIVVDIVVFVVAVVVLVLVLVLVLVFANVVVAVISCLFRITYLGVVGKDSSGVHFHGGHVVDDDAFFAVARLRHLPLTDGQVRICRVIYPISLRWKKEFIIG